MLDQDSTVFLFAGISKLNVDLSTGQVIVESSMGIDKVKEIIESTGRRAVLKGMGGSEGKLVVII